MGLRFRGRRAVVAGAAAVLSLGSAAAYAISAPRLPVLGPGVELEVPLDLPQPLVPPPDVQLPEPVVGPPDEMPDAGDVLGDVADDLSDDLSASGAGRRAAAKPHQPPEPDLDRALDIEAEIDRALESCGDAAERGDACDWGDWGDWGGTDGSGRVHVGDGLGVGNGDNITVLVDVGSEGNTGKVEQRNSGNGAVTCVNGDGSPPGC